MLKNTDTKNMYLPWNQIEVDLLPADLLWKLTAPRENARWKKSVAGRPCLLLILSSILSPDIAEWMYHACAARVVYSQDLSRIASDISIFIMLKPMWWKPFIHENWPWGLLPLLLWSGSW